MRLIFVALCLLLAISGSDALASFARLRMGGQPIPPFLGRRAGDHRSPCPILNTLANHGILPQTGTGITEDMLAQAFVNYIGTSKQFGGTFAKVAFAKFLKYAKKINPAATTISLSDLALPFENGGIAHNASLTRPDAPTTVDPQKYTIPAPDKSRILSVLGVTGKADNQVLSVSDLVAMRNKVNGDSGANAPFTHHLIGAAEICLLAGAGYGKKGLTPAWAKSFLINERFPKGYVTSNNFFGFGFISVTNCVASIEVRTPLSQLKEKLRGIPYFGFDQ